MHTLAAVLLVSSGMIVIVSKLILLWGLQQQQFLQRYHLRQEVWQMVFLIDKIVQRAGYCRTTQCKGISLKLSEHPPCIVVGYDKQPISLSANSHDFEHHLTYRLYQAQLQVSLGTDCHVGNWEALTDPARIHLQSLHFQHQDEDIILTLTASTANEIMSIKHLIVRHNW